MILRGLYGVWIIGYIACLIAFISVFFSSLKTIFKACSTPGYLSSFQAFFLIAILTPPQQLVDQSSKSSCLLNSFPITRSIDRASILDMVICSSTHAWHLHLSMAFFLTPTSIDCSIPLDTFICRDLLMAYIISSCDPQLISVDLSLNTSVFSTPKPLSLTPIFFLKISSSFFKFFFTW